jgi:hypothetical protein
MQEPTSAPIRGVSQCRFGRYAAAPGRHTGAQLLPMHGPRRRLLDGGDQRFWFVAIPALSIKLLLAARSRSSPCGLNARARPKAGAEPGSPRDPVSFAGLFPTFVPAESGTSRRTPVREIQFLDPVRRRRRGSGRAECRQCDGAVAPASTTKGIVRRLCCIGKSAVSADGASSRFRPHVK